MGEREIESCKARVGLAESYVDMKREELKAAQEDLARCKVLLEDAENEENDELWDKVLTGKEEA